MYSCVRTIVCVVFLLFMAPNRGLLSNYLGYRGMANRMQAALVTCTDLSHAHLLIRPTKHTRTHTDLHTHTHTQPLCQCRIIWRLSKKAKELKTFF